MSASKFYNSCYDAGYDRSQKARLLGIYCSWNECANETTWHGLYGFIDGFEGN